MKPYYSEPNIELYQGHVLSVLKEMQAESVDCCITSPPYWGLRTYKTEPQIWDNHNGCCHEWVSREWLMHNGRGDAQKSGKYSTQDVIPDMPAGDNSCSKCGAWRGELGLEPEIELYISHLLQIFSEVKRILKKTGSCWVNLGDSYNSAAWGNSEGNFRDPKMGIHKDIYADGVQNLHRTIKTILVPAKSLCAIPERFMIGMIDSGWICRNDIIWYKSNPMPESVKDRFTGTYEHVYFFVKNKKYWFEQQFEPHISSANEIARQYSDGCKDTEYATSKNYSGGVGYGLLGRNKRDVWEINTAPYPEAHFATFPGKLVETPILAGCPQNGTVLDIFAGSGTTLAVAKRLGRKAIGIELNPDYCKLVIKRLQEIALPMELGV